MFLEPVICIDFQVHGLCPELCVLTSTRVLVAGVLGAYAYLGPKAGREIFNLPSEQADVTFGAVTVLTGVFGTIAGGKDFTVGVEVRERNEADVAFGGVNVPIDVFFIVYTGLIS